MARVTVKTIRAKARKLVKSKRLAAASVRRIRAATTGSSPYSSARLALQSEFETAPARVSAAMRHLGPDPESQQAALTKLLQECSQRVDSLEIRAITLNGHRREFTPGMQLLKTAPVNARYTLEVVVNSGQRFFLVMPPAIMEIPLRNHLIENLRLQGVLTPTHVTPVEQPKADITVYRHKLGGLSVSVEGVRLGKVHFVDAD